MAIGHIKLESPENTEEMVKEKLQRVNEPGEVVKCLFDPVTMDDIADNFPENLRNAGHKPITQTDVSTTTVALTYVRRMRSAAESTHCSLLALQDLFETDPASKHAFCNHVYSKSWHRSIQSQTAEMC
jgi:hypothetical protein